MRPITIIGGGPAGLALGLALRGSDVPVELREAGRVPRHKLCGGVLTGDALAALDLPEPHRSLERLGARSLRMLELFGDRSGAGAQSLGDAVFGFSRWRLEELLAMRFKKAGGRLLPGANTVPSTDDGVVFTVGRQPAAPVQGWHHFALSVQATGLAWGERLELHLTPHGVVSLCPVEEGRLQLCGLFRARERPAETVPNWKDWLQGPPGSELSRRLGGAAWDAASLCAVRDLALGAVSADLSETKGPLCLGDATPGRTPILHGGVEHAFTAARVAAPFLIRYAAGDRPWVEAATAARQAVDVALARRRKWAARAQHALMDPVWSRRLLFASRGLPALQDWVFRAL